MSFASNDDNNNDNSNDFFFNRMILVVRCLWIDITYFIFIYFPESSDTLQKMAAFLCTHFIDQRIINPGV